MSEIPQYNVSHDTIKILDENIGSKISDISCSKIITDAMTKAKKKKKGKHK